MYGIGCLLPYGSANAFTDLLGWFVISVVACVFAVIIGYMKWRTSAPLDRHQTCTSRLFNRYSLGILFKCMPFFFPYLISKSVTVLRACRKIDVATHVGLIQENYLFEDGSLQCEGKK